MDSEVESEVSSRIASLALKYFGMGKSSHVIHQPPLSPAVESTVQTFYQKNEINDDGPDYDEVTSSQIRCPLPLIAAVADIEQNDGITWTNKDKMKNVLRSTENPQNAATRCWTEKALGVYVRSILSGSKTAHAVSKRPPYKVGDIVTFFSYQNGTHPAATVKVTSIKNYSSYISLVRNNTGALVPYAAKRAGVPEYSRNDTAVSEYAEYRWLLTVRKTTKSGRSAMTVSQFNTARPWLVTFERIDYAGHV